MIAPAKLRRKSSVKFNLIRVSSAGRINWRALCGNWRAAQKNRPTWHSSWLQARPLCSEKRHRHSANIKICFTAAEQSIASAAQCSSRHRNRQSAASAR